LQRVLIAVQNLVSQLSRPVVITADHGEMLGEDGRYIHGGLPHPLLCEVPWFTVDESMIGSNNQNISESKTKPETTISEQDVEEQLRDLGYL